MKNETGIGWNSISGTIDADDAWWNLKIAQDKNAAKFRDKGLEHMGLLEEIFGDLLATKEYQYTPSATNFGEYCDSWSTPQRPKSMETSGFDAQHAAQYEEVNSPMRGSTSRFRGKSQSRSGPKRKSNEFDEWSNQVENLKKSYMDAQSSERRYHHVIKTPQAPVDPSARSMQECVVVLDAIEGLNGRDRLYQAGLEAFELRKKRSIWLCIKDDESQLIWLQRQMKLQNR